MSVVRRGAIARLGAALLAPTVSAVSTATVIAGMAIAPAAWAQGDWPSQPVRVVVPFTAGSGTDVVGRAVAERLDKRLGQPLVIDNKPGAGGTLGAAMVATAAPDGNTLLIHSSGHVANAALYPKLRYDTAKDFKPVAMLATLPNVLVVSPNAGVKTVAELLAKAKAEPGKLTYGSAGNGSATHINAEKFRLAAKVDAVHVPYRGTPEALVGVMSGDINWFFAPLVSAMPLIKNGKLVPLAVGSASRSSALPQVPTTIEAGLPDSAYTFWVGLFAPVKTPQAIIDRLSADTAEVLKAPEVKARLDTLGAELPTISPAQFAPMVAKEIDGTAKLIRDAGIRAE